MNRSIMMALTILSFGSVAIAGQGAGFQSRHPRRAQINKRVKNEERRNEAAEKSGDLTEKQENKLNRQDRRIKQEERADVKANGGHLTKKEQRHLNHELNHVNQERANMEKRNESKAVGAPAPVAPATPAATQ